MPRDIVRKPFMSIAAPVDSGNPTYVDMSSELTGIMMPQQTREERQVTAGGADHEFVGTRPKRMAGANFIQNFDAGKVYATLQSLFDSNSGRVLVKMRHSTDAIGATNPEAGFTAVILSLPTFEGELDAVPSVDLSLRISGSVTWSTS